MWCERIIEKKLKLLNNESVRILVSGMHFQMALENQSAFDQKHGVEKESMRVRRTENKASGEMNRKCRQRRRLDNKRLAWKRRVNWTQRAENVQKKKTRKLHDLTTHLDNRGEDGTRLVKTQV